VQQCDFDLPPLFQGADGKETHWGTSQFRWEAKCFLWPCILSTSCSCLPRDHWEARRELVAASAFGKVEYEGSKLVKLSIIHKAEHVEEGCLLLVQSEGLVHC